MTLFEPMQPQVRPRIRQRRRAWPTVLGIVSALVLVAVVVVLAPWDPTRGRFLQDSWTAITSPPSTEVKDIATATAMSDLGTRIFYATQPEIDTASTFNDHCTADGVLLGCYTSRDRIFVFRVSDARLAGTIESTAAHEMLHAAYARLPDADRSALDAQLQAYLDALPADAAIRKELSSYAAGQWLDELHSRLGVEVATLPAPLEAHYAAYFSDGRVALLARYAASQAAFVQATAEIDALAGQLDALRTDLRARLPALDADTVRLNADIAAFNTRAQQAGGFASQADFDRAAAALDARTAALEQRRVAYNSDVTRYNDLVAQLRTLDANRAALYGSLDSRATPAPTSAPAPIAG